MPTILSTARYSSVVVDCDVSFTDTLIEDVSM